jgi:hypothetical protein
LYQVVLLHFSVFSACRHDVYDGGVPEGGVPPDGGVPEGCVPFISIPAGGVPEGLVPFISIPAGGVPCGPPDWLKAGLSPVLAAWSGVADEAAEPELPASAVTAACTWPVDDAVVVWPDELLSVHPATRIPATRIANAISMIRLLFFIGYSPNFPVRRIRMLQRRIFVLNFFLHEPGGVHNFF